MSTDIASITPIPTEEEAAAIAAAVTMMWPQPASPATAQSVTHTTWRFSGRWWANDAISRRGRPGS